jgi:aldose 1-epimerase
MLESRHLLTALGVSLMIATSASQAAGLTNQRSAFGKTDDGTAVEKFVLRNSHGMEATVITYGGILQSLSVPDKQGKTADVVLGFDDVQGYQKNGSVYFGATIGRFGNRLADGAFELDGKRYQVPQNDHGNSLHGGPQGFDKHVWKAQPHDGKDSVGVTLTYVSPDGEMGFPGTLKTDVTYSLNEQNELRIEYAASTDKPTVLNLTNHSYFNLAGPASGTILGHELRLEADQYTPVDDTLIPTGAIEPVQGTPLDFTTSTPIGARIDQLKGDPGGYDHNMVLRRRGEEPTRAARVHDPESGRVLEVLTTEPGLQFYSGNFLDGTNKGKGGVVYRKHQAFCLEADHFPDAVHHPNFPSIILRPGQTYRQTTLYKFSAE